MKTLYQKDLAGRVRFWRVEIDVECPSRYRSVSGLLDGENPVTSEWTEAQPKNAGRSNERSAEEQARAECEALVIHKLSRKYHETVHEARLAEATHKFLAPMLAKKFDSEKVKFPVFVQPKLDGVRCVASATGLTTRQGRVVTSCPHVERELELLFERHPDLVLDGELYTHDLRDDFNSIVSAVRRSEPSEESSRVQYHVYDMVVTAGGPSSMAPGFSDRHQQLSCLFQHDLCGSRVVVPVRTAFAETARQLEAAYADFMAEGYEGAMVRLDSPYEIGRRSRSLLKWKEFEDAEFPLVSVDEGLGNWSGMAKTVTIDLGDGREQSAGMRGTTEFARQLLAEWRKYSAVTVRYQRRTPDGLLRFPIVVDWHEGERAD
jgi:DNA ligase-1